MVLKNAFNDGGKVTENHKKEALTAAKKRVYYWKRKNNVKLPEENKEKCCKTEVQCKGTGCNAGKCQSKWTDGRDETHNVFNLWTWLWRNCAKFIGEE